MAESRRQCEAALRFLVEVRLAFPEVLQAIKTKQLAQEILLFKEDHIVNLAKTGLLHNIPVISLLPQIFYHVLHIRYMAGIIYKKFVTRRPHMHYESQMYPLYGSRECYWLLIGIGYVCLLNARMRDMRQASIIQSSLIVQASGDMHGNGFEAHTDKIRTKNIYLVQEACSYFAQKNINQ